MLPATLLSPSDNKPILGWFKSILSTCTAASDNASRSGQQIRAAQATSWPPQQLHRPENQRNQGKISGFLRENRSLLMTSCPPIEKSIILLCHYCMHPVILFHYCIYPVILYKTTVILKKNGSYTHVRPPPTQKFRPSFFESLN
jgi:hypothetical protein